MTRSGEADHGVRRAFSTTSRTRLRRPCSSRRAPRIPRSSLRPRPRTRLRPLHRDADAADRDTFRPRLSNHDDRLAPRARASFPPRTRGAAGVELPRPRRRARRERVRRNARPRNDDQPERATTGAVVAANPRATRIPPAPSRTGVRMSSTSGSARPRVHPEHVVERQARRPDRHRPASRGSRGPRRARQSEDGTTAARAGLAPGPRAATSRRRAHVAARRTPAGRCALRRLAGQRPRATSPPTANRVVLAARSTKNEPSSAVRLAVHVGPTRRGRSVDNLEQQALAFARRAGAHDCPQSPRDAPLAADHLADVVLRRRAAGARRRRRSSRSTRTASGSSTSRRARYSSSSATAL